LPPRRPPPRSMIRQHPTTISRTLPFRHPAPGMRRSTTNEVAANITSKRPSVPNGAQRRRTTMDTSQFWQIIERSKAESGGDCDKQVDALTTILLELPAEEIEEFATIFGRFHAQAYRNDVWAAAYIMNDGCSDDAFMDFRSWLIGQGEAVYTAA